MSQSLEGFLQRCPTDCRTHLEAVLLTSLKFIKYDPNFAEDDAMEQDEAEEEDEEG